MIAKLFPWGTLRADDASTGLPEAGRENAKQHRSQDGGSRSTRTVYGLRSCILALVSVIQRPRADFASTAEGFKTMTINRRNILGEPNPYDNKLPPVGTAGIGGTDILGTRGVDAAPVDGDQGSLDTAEARAQIARGYRQGQLDAGKVVYDGATGTTAGDPDELVTGGPAAFDGGGVGDVIAPNPLVTRHVGGANLDDSGPGQSVGGW